jgi:hypothetical protein
VIDNGVTIQAMNLMIDIESTLNRAALEHPAPRAIRVVSYTEDYVVSTYSRNNVMRGLTK